MPLPPVLLVTVFKPMGRAQGVLCITHPVCLPGLSRGKQGAVPVVHLPLALPAAPQLLTSPRALSLGAVPPPGRPSRTGARCRGPVPVSRQGAPGAQPDAWVAARRRRSSGRAAVWAALGAALTEPAALRRLGTPAARAERAGLSSRRAGDACGSPPPPAKAAGCRWVSPRSWRSPVTGKPSERPSQCTSIYGPAWGCASSARQPTFILLKIPFTVFQTDEVFPFSSHREFCLTATVIHCQITGFPVAVVFLPQTSPV